eukprot:gnl/TRDRNA2_/TRDRNA2_187667_c0_seq1.p1 gnl/TRDRNA2_/TRDRNA2_187667_c0~~gnl/TRDRNA2_/TRDRNA2_187667_c0_seq1.p1  ORF type:complete len:420 (+),score=43.41 gnl/TRDRNA2_/TRDRNA2_187667_c0_seq1:75-1334(+)
MDVLVRLHRFSAICCTILACLSCSVSALTAPIGKRSAGSELTTSSHCESAKSTSSPIRFGVLSAAGINNQSIIGPAAKNPQTAIVTAFACRDPSRAKQYQQSIGDSLKTATVYRDYQDLLDNADIDAVYVPLPNGLHYEWTMKALKAGKHVLCEKPFASNAQEAKEMVKLAKEKGLVLMEAFHWYYHPFRERMQEIMKSGAIGKVQSINVTRRQGGKDPYVHDAVLKLGKDLMGWRLGSELAGGAMMDLGAYAFDAMCALIGEVPVLSSVKALTLESDSNVDAKMSGNVSFVKSGIQGTFDCGLLGPEPYAARIKVIGTEGVMVADGFTQPHNGGQIFLLDHSGHIVSSEKVDSHGSTTYDLQLQAFAEHVQQVREGSQKAWSFPNTGDDPVTNMELLDQAYLMAGLKPRQGPSGIAPS